MAATDATPRQPGAPLPNAPPYATRTEDQRLDQDLPAATTTTEPGGTSARFRRLTGNVTVCELTARMDKDLVDRGLLLSRWRRRATEYSGVVLICEALLGILLCGSLSSFLPLAWTGFIAVIVWRVGRMTSRSAAGDAELERLREVHERLGPWHRPSWSLLTRNTAALYVALYGLEAVETTDAEFVACAGLRWRSGGLTDDSAVHSDTGPDF
ncbi:hypothetical protein GCM10023321_14990 [Pseudonocardia eucalypti]|uniref:Uncharacterized protein n=1 Tax=Pseudonocardia eucalypti TaxID=648755 RepID=A0ABP9PTT9_9PSEU|nr:uncharacterized protein (TIGR04222 family) [Pseudonocardia eucalypti]